MNSNYRAKIIPKQNHGLFRRNKEQVKKSELKMLVTWWRWWRSWCDQALFRGVLGPSWRYHVENCQNCQRFVRIVVMVSAWIKRPDHCYYCFLEWRTILCQWPADVCEGLFFYVTSWTTNDAQVRFYEFTSSYYSNWFIIDWHPIIPDVCRPMISENIIPGNEPKTILTPSSLIMFWLRTVHFPRLKER